MTKKILKNKPLVEAIFELRWELQRLESGMMVDPKYKVLVGRIYDRIKDDYPYYEQLPTANIPDEAAAYVVQHRFRKKKNDWPLIQIGPGIITVNDTENYDWEDFKDRIKKIINVLFESYIDTENSLKISSLILRYIDAIEFDYNKDNILFFLKDNFKIDLSVYDKLFEETGVENSPVGIDMKLSYRASKPKGLITLRFVRGEVRNSESLIWETLFQSFGEDVPKTIDTIIEWCNQGHDLTDNWFFKLIEGDLRRRFE